MHSLRVLAVGILMHVKMRATSAFDGLLGILWPLFFALIAFFLFRAGTGPEGLVYASYGAAVMGVWSATSTSAGSALQRERWHGTLELLAAAPVRNFALILLPITITLAAIGIYSMVTTLLVARFVFGVDLPLEDPLAFVAAVPVTIGSVGTAGFLLAVAFVRYRAGWALGNMLEFPVWLIAGFLVPLSLLPGWVRPISWILPPTWGMNAIREAAVGGTPWPDIGMCVLLAGVYTAVGVLAVDHMLTSARKRASLALT
jgi:ABC-2 type transport system permease protein